VARRLSQTWPGIKINRPGWAGPWSWVRVAVYIFQPPSFRASPSLSARCHALHQVHLQWSVPYHTTKIPRLLQNSVITVVGSLETENQGGTGWPGFTWKMAVKTVCVCEINSMLYSAYCVHAAVRSRWNSEIKYGYDMPVWNWPQELLPSSHWQIDFGQVRCVHSTSTELCCCLSSSYGSHTCSLVTNRQKLPSHWILADIYVVLLMCIQLSIYPRKSRKTSQKLLTCQAIFVMPNQKCISKCCKKINTKKITNYSCVC